MLRTIGHLVGGRAVPGQSGRFNDVFQPMTGELIARVALASTNEVRQAVENAKAAQTDWGATNPQRRARVMMKFLELIARETDALADLLAREHGKTIPDAKGDIQRGVEVVEFACGIPHLMKGEYTEGAGPGIDIYSMRQPLGVVAGITPFNFPAMIPMWKFAPAIACGNAFILKPSERDPGVPMRLAELMMEAGLPAGILNVVNGDKEAVDAILDDPDVMAVGFVGSTPIAEYVYSRATAHGKRAQCFGSAKNHMIIMPDADMDQAVDALIGAGYGSAGERCMAVSVAVPVGKGTADALMEKLTPRVESLKVAPRPTPPPTSARSSPRRISTRCGLTSISGCRRARSSSWTGATSACRATRTVSTWVAASLTRSGPRCASTRRKSSDRCSRWCAPGTTTRRCACRTSTNTATASLSTPAMGTRRATSPPRSMSAWSA